MSSATSAGNQISYRNSQHATVLSEINAVICVLFPRAILVAGFDAAGILRLAQYNYLDADMPAWHLDFFQHDFINEKLMGVPQQLKAIFIGTEDELIIPNDVFEEALAKDWLRNLRAVCPDDVFKTFELKDAGAQYTYNLSGRMDKLLHRYFGQTPILPLAAYQFHKPNTGKEHLLSCVITESLFVGSLFQLGKLQWHRQFSYNTIEDIAWELVNLCKELHIGANDLVLECGIIRKDSYDFALELERYFPAIRWSADEGKDLDPWSPFVYLAQQLYACAL